MNFGSIKHTSPISSKNFIRKDVLVNETSYRIEFFVGSSKQRFEIYNDFDNDDDMSENDDDLSESSRLRLLAGQKCPVCGK